MIGSCAGMDRGAAEVPELAAARARAGEPLVVAQLRVDRLRRPRQAGGDGGVDDPAARPVEPRFERAGLRAEVGLAERDPGDSRSARDRVRGLETRGRLDQAVHRAGRSRARPPAGRPSARRRRSDCEHRDGLQVVRVTGVDPDVDRLLARRRRAATRGSPAPRPWRPARRRPRGRRSPRAPPRRSPSRPGRGGRPGTYSQVSGGTLRRHRPRAAARAPRRRRRAPRAPLPCPHPACRRRGGSRRASPRGARSRSAS